VITSPLRRLTTALAVVSALALGLGDLQAKPKGGSGGSRGSHSNVAPPTTNTAPRQAQPLPDATPRAANPSAASSAARPGAPAAAPASSWKSGLMGGIAGGLLGAGLFGLLSGNGFMGGLGSLMGLLGFIAQIAILFFIVRFAISFFRRKQAQPAMAGGAAGGPEAYARSAMQPEWQPSQASAQPAAVPSEPLTLAEADFQNFERLLGEIQLAYGAGDRITLSQRATPGMANDFNAELAELARAGLTNRISDVKLLQGDLSEAWREPGAEYATVTMRYSLIDATIERASGKVVEGDANTPQEAIEYWTFVRAPGETPADWKLSAIQPMS
jgi:predicted lipid-binding transport protein (Tim44 family)